MSAVADHDAPLDAEREEPGGGDPLGPVAVYDEQTDVAVDLDRVHAVAVRALELLGVPAAAQLTVSLADTPTIAELKRTYFGVDEATDVLSFPIDEVGEPAPGPLVLGDVVICPAVALRQARALGRALEDELDQLLVHGILHLLGRDHADARGERAMMLEERRVLAALEWERAS